MLTVATIQQTGTVLIVLRFGRGQRVSLGSRLSDSIRSQNPGNRDSDRERFLRMAQGFDKGARLAGYHFRQSFSEYSPISSAWKERYASRPLLRQLCDDVSYVLIERAVSLITCSGVTQVRQRDRRRCAIALGGSKRSHRCCCAGGDPESRSGDPICL